VRRADAVFTPAHFLREKAARIFRPRVTVGFMPNLIEVPDPLPAKPATPTLTFIGRLDRRKRPELFLDLAKRFPRYNFVVVGKAESEQRDRHLRNECAALPNVLWEGYIDRFKQPERMRDVLAKTWALVNTASREGLPLTFLEAAAYGCAIVSEVNPDDFATRFGRHVADGDFARAVDTFFSNPQGVQEKGAEARRYVQQTYEAQTAAQTHVDMYLRLLESRLK
jgi:glycosyltransferase involved in cell wall biosynthesis